MSVIAIDASIMLFSQQKMKRPHLLPIHSPFAPPTSTTQDTAPPTEEEVLNTDQELEDEALMHSISQGMEWAMEMLYQRYYRYAYALAYRILHDTTAAEDIVQDVFLAVWRKAASYQEQHGTVRGWLQAIVHHRAIDRVRASAHRDQQWTSLQMENEYDHPSEQGEVWEEVWRREKAQVIRRVLAELPQEQRLVIELAYFGGYTHVQIAEHWHVPLGTVKGRMRLGLQKMKQLLRSYGMETL